MSALPVTFFHPYPDKVEWLRRDGIDVDRDWERVLTPRRQGGWISQTYLRLRNAGYDVRIDAALPPRGIVVVGPGGKQARAFMERYTSAHRDLIIVQIVADAERAFIEDLAVYQNGRYANGHGQFIPYWPQPGLVPRDASRGTRCGCSPTRATRAT